MSKLLPNRHGARFTKFAYNFDPPCAQIHSWRVTSSVDFFNYTSVFVCSSLVIRAVVHYYYSSSFTALLTLMVFVIQCQWCTIYSSLIKSGNCLVVVDVGVFGSASLLCRTTIPRAKSAKSLCHGFADFVWFWRLFWCSIGLLSVWMSFFDN